MSPPQGEHSPNEVGLRRPEAALLHLVEGYVATGPTGMPGTAPWALLRLGRTARALEVFQAMPTSNDIRVLLALWGPDGRAARTSPEFPDFARRTGLADVWERDGAPDLCRRIGSRDFACR